MNRIFYIHSNIVSLCIYHSVKECLTRNEKVIIVVNRGCVWPFFKGLVTVYDFSKIFEGEDKDRIPLRSIRGIIDYMRFRGFIAHLDRVINEIVNKEDFIFYLPSMALVMTSTFVKNKFCKGYYFVDEGYLAYSPDEILQLYQPNRRFNYIKSILRIEDHFHLEISEKFRGTVSITKEAFAWNLTYEKIINPINEYVEGIRCNIPFYDDVILTEYLTQDYNIITQSIDYCIKAILKEKPYSKIGMKIHPHAITYNKSKTILIQNYIKDNYEGIVSLIPANVPIEVMSLVYNPHLYSLLELSSIILYALLFKSSRASLITYCNETVSIKDVTSIKEYNENIV